MNKKAPVVLVHGMWSTPETLNDLKAVFEKEGHEVVVPRLPWHLARKQMDQDAQRQLAVSTVQDYVEAILESMSQLDEKPILLGHSMGGILAQIVASQVPVDRLILLSTGGIAGINGWSWSMIRTFGRNLLLFPLWKHVTKLRLDNVRYGIANTQTPSVQKEIIQNVTYESGTVSWQLGMWFLFKKPPSYVDCEKVKCPVLVIGGDQDRITPISIQAKTATKYGDRAKLVRLEGACHWTIGGSHFNTVRSHIMEWLGHTQVAEAA